MPHSHVGMGQWGPPIGDLCGYDKNFHDSAIFKG